jgi:hypothetical protein
MTYARLMAASFEEVLPMANGKDDFQPDYVERCAGAVENLIQKCFISIALFSFLMVLLFIPELLGDSSSSATSALESLANSNGSYCYTVLGESTES